MQSGAEERRAGSLPPFITDANQNLACNQSHRLKGTLNLRRYRDHGSPAVLRGDGLVSGLDLRGPAARTAPHWSARSWSRVRASTWIRRWRSRRSALCRCRGISCHSRRPRCTSAGLVVGDPGRAAVAPRGAGDRVDRAGCALPAKGGGDRLQLSPGPVTLADHDCLARVSPAQPGRGAGAGGVAGHGRDLLRVLRRHRRNELRVTPCAIALGDREWPGGDRRAIHASGPGVPQGEAPACGATRQRVDRRAPAGALPGHSGQAASASCSSRRAPGSRGAPGRRSQ